MCASSRRGQAPQAGLEPATVGLEVRRSIQLSYWGPADEFYNGNTGVSSLERTARRRDGRRGAWDPLLLPLRCPAQVRAGRMPL
jgi:hypothetical protein